MDLLETDFAEPYRAWKTRPAPDTSGRVLAAVRPVIDSAVKSYAGGSASPLLTSRARRIVLDALPGYDATRGPLRPYLDSHLRGLRRLAANQDEVIAVPERVRLDRHHIYEAENRLRDWLGRDPTDSELADETGLSPRRLAHVRKAAGAVAEGTLEAAGDPDDPLTPAVVQPDDGVWHNFVYAGLQPRDQLVMQWSLGLNGGPVLSGKQIAAKLGVTPAAVAQRKARIQKLLNQRQELKVL